MAQRPVRIAVGAGGEADIQKAMALCQGLAKMKEQARVKYCYGLRQGGETLSCGKAAVKNRSLRRGIIFRQSFSCGKALGFVLRQGGKELVKVRR